MIVRQYAPCSLGRSIIRLGKQGEINALRVEFDVSAWMAMYPDATVKLMHFAPDRPQDNPVIPTLGVEGTLRVWIVGEEDTAGAGNGVIELLLIDERTGSTIKSATGYTTVLRSPSAGIEAQEPEPGYVRYDVDQSALLTDTQKAFARTNIDAIKDEKDPTVPDWAKQPRKPTYTASEVGALPSSYTPPVTSVNGMTGAVALSAQDVGARPDTWTPSASEVGADAAGTASGAVAAHNVSGAAHADLRALIDGLTSRLNALADSDDTTLDQLSEIVAYIKSNKALIDAVTTGKVSTSDIVDNLTTNASGKVLSAAQGVALKAMIDGIVIPTALPNPQPITINGQRYDGSDAVTVTTAEIDDTLTQSGKAADAKAVGDQLSALNGANATQDELLNQLKSDLIDLSNDTKRYNYFSPNWDTTKFINNVDGTIGTLLANAMIDGTGYGVSQPVKVHAGDNIDVRAIYTGKSAIYFLDRDTKILSYSNLTKNNNDVLGNTFGTYDEFTIDSGVSYIAVCSRSQSAGMNPDKSVNNVAMLSINSDLPSNFIPYEYKFHSCSTMNGQWRGKKMACLGTSLTANGGWIDVVKERLGFEKAYNRGAGGTTLADFSSYSPYGYVVYENVYTDTENYDEARTSVFCDDTSTATRPYENKRGAWYSSDMRISLLPTDADVVVIDLCTNDFYRSWNQEYVTTDDFIRETVIQTADRESVGAYEYDAKYYRDAFMLMVKKVMAQCPNARIVVWGMLYNSTINSSDGSFDYYLKLIDITKDMCRRTGVYFIDTMSEMGVNVFNSLDIIQDGVHPCKANYTNEIGKYMVAESIIRCLSNITPIVRLDN